MRLLVLTMLVLAAAGCDPDFPKEKPGPTGRFSSAALWKAPNGYDLDRMILPDLDGNWPLYRTQWNQTGQSQKLVCVQYPGGELFGTPYRIYLYDRKLSLLRRGRITAQQDQEPLAIVEVKAAGRRIPADRRDQWQLAVVLAHRDEAWDPARPVRLVGFDEPDDEANYVMCELITWDDEDDTTRGAGSLSDVETIEFRTAEKNWRVAADGTLQLPPGGFGRGAP